MVALTVLLELWAADIKFIPKWDLIIILKYSVVSWRKSVGLFLRDLLHEESKILLEYCALANVLEVLTGNLHRKDCNYKENSKIKL